MSKKIWGVLALLWVSPLLLAEESVREIELSVPLSGVVQQVLVEQGQSVKKGELLLKLDPRRYQIRLNYAEAALQEVEVLVETQARVRPPHLNLSKNCDKLLMTLN